MQTLGPYIEDNIALPANAAEALPDLAKLFERILRQNFVNSLVYIVNIAEH